jgi:hypothetical protein
MFLLDVSKPKKPVQLGQINLPSGMQTHSITVYPGGADRLRQSGRTPKQRPDAHTHHQHLEPGEAEDRGNLQANGATYRLP